MANDFYSDTSVENFNLRTCSIRRKAALNMSQSVHGLDVFYCRTLTDNNTGETKERWFLAHSDNVVFEAEKRNPTDKFSFPQGSVHLSERNIRVIKEDLVGNGEGEFTFSTERDRDVFEAELAKLEKKATKLAKAKPAEILE